mmetsp:Transcript_23061/g.70845  ORF Transcript_23061/g.70845 Transcript_23061/m.70845 type:complete len:238 (-) Transcript_23061:401-1114(-)
MRRTQGRYAELKTEHAALQEDYRTLRLQLETSERIRLKQKELLTRSPSKKTPAASTRPKQRSTSAKFLRDRHRDDDGLLLSKNGVLSTTRAILLDDLEGDRPRKRGDDDDAAQDDDAPDEDAPPMPPPPPRRKSDFEDEEDDGLRRLSRRRSTNNSTTTKKPPKQRSPPPPPRQPTRSSSAPPKSRLSKGPAQAAARKGVVRATSKVAQPVLKAKSPARLRRVSNGDPPLRRGIPFK